MNDLSPLKKDQIFEIAKSIFAKYGYSKATMDDIAKHMGMKKNSLYYYFPSKEAIFEEVIKRESENFFKQVLSDVDSKKTASEKVKKFVLSSLQNQRKRINLHSATTEAILDINFTYNNFYQKLQKRQNELLAQIIEDGINNKEFKKTNSYEVAECIITLASSIEFKDFCKSKDKFYMAKGFSQVDKKIIILLNLILDGLKRPH